MTAFNISRESALDLINDLTPRENQVAELLAMGTPRKDIAQTLRISPKTLDMHVVRVKAKLGVTQHGVGRIYFAAMQTEGL